MRGIVVLTRETIRFRQCSQRPWNLTGEFHTLVRVKARKIGIFLFAATIFEAEARCSCPRFQFRALVTQNKAAYKGPSGKVSSFIGDASH